MEAAVQQLFSEEKQKEFMNEGFLAQVNGKDMVKDNPYLGYDPRHWLWRKGFIEAFKEENGIEL